MSHHYDSAPTPEVIRKSLESLAQDCGWKSLAEMKAAVLRLRAHHEGMTS
jgi:hypothetical protein